MEGYTTQGHSVMKGYLGFHHSGLNSLMPVARTVSPMLAFLQGRPQPTPASAGTEEAAAQSSASTQTPHGTLPAWQEMDDSNHRAQDLAFSAGPPAAAAVVLCAPLPSSAAAQLASWQPRGNN